MKKTALIALVTTAMVFAAFGVAVAATTVGTVGGAAGHAGVLGTEQNVLVTATVNPKLTLTLDQNVVDFGAQDPGWTSPVTPIDIDVQSNKDFTMEKAVSGDTAELGFTSTLAATTNDVKGEQSYTDDYQINIPWTTSPGAYDVNVQYTVYQ